MTERRNENKQLANKHIIYDPQTEEGNSYHAKEHTRTLPIPSPTAQKQMVTLALESKGAPPHQLRRRREMP